MKSDFYGLLLSLAMVCMGAMNMAAAEVRLEATDGGGFLCKTAAYEARVGADGRLQSVRAGGTEFLALPAAFVHKGQFVAFKAVRQAGPTIVTAEGEPKDPAKSVPNSPCAFNVRVGYEFKPDRIELTLEQSLDVYGAFAWVPSASVRASRDALTDCPTAPQGPSLYGQTDPRWTTRKGPVLRFDFGVWQRAFANANWATLKVGGKDVRYMHNTAPAARAMKVSVYPLAQPSAKDALTFDISATNPDFLLPGGHPVHFDIKVTNAGPQPVEALVRFEVRDYLTQQPVAVKPTDVKLPSQGERLLPTDLPLQAPGPYRAAIVIEEGGKPTRSFWWLFTYDFGRYAPPTTRPPDFEQFWKDALVESLATPLDPRVGFCMPYHSGLPRLDWTVKHEPGYWPFGMGAKPQGQAEEQFLTTLSYFDPANFTQGIRCPMAAEVGMMDTVTAAGNQLCALAHVPKGQLFLVCSPWAMHGAGSRAPGLASECYNRFLKGEKPILTPTRP